MTDLAKALGYATPPEGGVLGSALPAAPADIVARNLLALRVLSKHLTGAGAGELAKDFLPPEAAKAQSIRGIFRRLENAELCRIENVRKWGQSRPKWYITPAGEHAVKNQALPDRWYDSAGFARPNRKGEPL